MLMLNIINIKKNSKSTNVSREKVLNRSTRIKHFSPAIKEWNNSIYVYNKNTLNLIPISNKIIIKLIKSYYNLYNRKLEIKKRRQTMRIKLRRLSSHKIYVSRGEFKHTSEKVIINIYTYNRQKYNYLYKIKKILKNLLKRKYFLKKMKILKKKTLVLINNELKNVLIHKNILYKELLIYCIKKHLKKSLKRHLLFFYYKRLFLLNKFKFKYTYLNTITNLIEKVYNKNVELNVINLKYFYLNSDIYTESIINKITKDRKRLYRILKRSVQKAKIANRNWMINHEDDSYIQKLSIQKMIDTNNIQTYLSLKANKKINKTKPVDKLSYFLRKIYYNTINEEQNTLKNTVLGYLKNKTITGVRLEATGRLSKRHTASRSVSKLRYKGSLRNRDSSYKGLSSKILRGNTKTNIQYTNINSIARIGSFGLKGWISNN